MAVAQSSVCYRPIQRFPAYRIGDDGSIWFCWNRLSGKGMGRNQWITDETQWWRRKPVPNKWGYLLIGLTPGPGRRQVPRQVHRLVLETFVGPCPPEMQCCHWDGDRQNNALSNLRWGTRAENWADSLRYGISFRGERNPAAKLTVADVLEIRKRHDAGETQMAIAKAKGVTHSLIWRIVHRLKWQHV